MVIVVATRTRRLGLTAALPGLIAAVVVIAGEPAAIVAISVAGLPVHICVLLKRLLVGLKIERTGHRGRETSGLRLRDDFLLARLKALSQRAHVDTCFLGVCEDPVARLLLFAD